MTILTQNLFPQALAGFAGAPLKVAFFTTDLPQSTLQYAFSADETSGTGYPVGGYAVTPTWNLNESGASYTLSLAPLVVNGTFYVQSMLLYRSDTNDAIAVISTGGIDVAGAQLTVNFPNPIFNIQI